MVLVGIFFLWYTKNCETKLNEPEHKSCLKSPPTNPPTNPPTSPPTSRPYPGYNNYYPQSLYYPDFLYSRNVYLDNVMNGYYPGYTYTWANGNGWNGNGNGERVNKNINNISVNVPSSGQSQNK